MHRSSFGGYCVCPAGHPCVGVGCIALGSGRRKLYQGFQLKDCPECRCENRDENWDQSEDAAKVLIMVDGAEGMGSWRFAIAEILFLARMTGRLLVSMPCVDSCATLA